MKHFAMEGSIYTKALHGSPLSGPPNTGGPLASLYVGVGSIGWAEGVA